MKRRKGGRERSPTTAGLRCPEDDDDGGGEEEEEGRSEKEAKKDSSVFVREEG